MEFIQGIKQVLLGIPPEAKKKDEEPASKGAIELSKECVDCGSYAHMGFTGIKHALLGLPPEPIINREEPASKAAIELSKEGVECPECGTSNIQGYECPNCRFMLTNYYKVCPHCFSLVAPDNLICNTCKETVQEVIKEEKPEDNWATVFSEEDNLTITLSMDIEDILRNSWFIFSQKWNYFLLIALCGLPFNLVQWYYIVYKKHKTYGLGLIYGPVVYAVFGTLTIYLAYKIIKGEEPSLNEIIRQSLSKYKSVLWAELLSGVIIYLLFLLIVPGLIWSVYYVFVLNVVVIRGVKGKAALDYSKLLVKGRWWKLFYYFFVFVTLMMLPSAISSILSVWYKGILIDVIGASATALLGLFGPIIWTVIFINMEYTYCEKHQSELVSI